MKQLCTNRRQDAMIVSSLGWTGEILGVHHPQSCELTAHPRVAREALPVIVHLGCNQIIILKGKHFN
jgi:hypothetical protein